MSGRKAYHGYLGRKSSAFVCSLFNENLGATDGLSPYKFLAGGGPELPSQHRLLPLLLVTHQN